MLDFRIATFLQLCETRSYTKTAKLLDITQPSVTQHIKYLQKKYQCKLFRYEGKILHLTPEGEYLRRHAESMTKMSARIAADLQRMSSGSKAIRFGYPKELGEVCAARIVAKMISPKQEISLCIKNTEELLHLLANGQLDVILIDEAFVSETFTAVSAGKVSFYGYTASKKEKSEVPAPFETLMKHRLLIGEPGTSDRSVLESFMEKHHYETEDFASVMTCSTPACLQELAAAGTGIMFGYASCMRESKNRLYPLQIADFPEERSLVFLYSKDNLNAENFKPFFEEFKTLWEKNLKR